MSKEKTPKIKRKTTALDIVSRVITCGLAVAIPAAAYVLSIIYYEFQSTALALLSKYMGNENDDGTTYGYITIKGFIKDFWPTIASSSEKDSNAAGELWTALEPVHGAIYATGILFALTLVIAVVIFFTACFSNSNKLPLIFSALGLCSAFGMAVAFRGITAPILDGTLSLSQTLASTLLGGLFGSSDIMAILGTLLGSLSQLIINFTVINLSTAWVTILVCYVILIIWHGAMLVISLGETPKAPKAKE